MNKKTIYSVKNIVIMIVFITMSLRASSQTELTTEMVWQEGTHWIYPVFIPYDYDGTPLNITYLHECRLVKRYYEEFDDYYLVLEHRTNENGAWRDNWRDYYENLKVEGNKVYEFIISGGYNGQPFETTNKYLVYDFDSWVDGGNAYFEYENMDHILSVPNFPLDNMQQIVTDPEGKYYSYAFSGEYSIGVHYNVTNLRLQTTFIISEGHIFTIDLYRSFYSGETAAWPFDREYS